jgi:hypothetical protein
MQANREKEYAMPDTKPTPRPKRQPDPDRAFTLLAQMMLRQHEEDWRAEQAKVKKNDSKETCSMAAKIRQKDSQ